VDIHEVSTELLILPGMGEGYAKRGSAWAWILPWREFVKHLNPKAIRNYVVYEVAAPTWYRTSDGEMMMLIGRIATAQEEFLAQLEAYAKLMFGRALRRRAMLDLVLYVLAILSIAFYWIIYLLIPDYIFTGRISSWKLKKAKVLERTERFWRMSRDEPLIEAVTDIWAQYASRSGSPMERYEELARYAESRAKENPAYAKVARAYRDILAHLRRDSPALASVPIHNWKGRLLIWLEKFPIVPDPENVFPVRFDQPDRTDRIWTPRTLLLERRISPTRQELYLLWGKQEMPVVVPNLEYTYPLRSLWRATLLASGDEPLDFILHVGSEDERTALFAATPELPESATHDRIREVVSRIQNAALDTLRSDEAYLAYHLAAWPGAFGGWMSLAMLRLGWDRGDPFRNFVSWTFPWLFFANALPMQAIIAASWLFVSPVLAELDVREAQQYFARSLAGLHVGYRNVRLRPVVNEALGEVNEKLRSGADWHEVVEDINLSALPPRLLHHAIFNAIATETDQLILGRREANNFIALPLFFKDGKFEFRPEVKPQFTS
jgi:hypothetical protein